MSATQEMLKNYVRVTYRVQFPEGYNPGGRSSSDLWPRYWWDQRKKALDDPSGVEVVKAALRATVLCPYTITQLEIDEHPTI